MTISSSVTKIQYTGNGSTTAFAYPFKILDESEVEVLLVASDGTETLQVITTNYTVSGVGNDAGGTVTMITAPTSTQDLVLRRKPAFSQLIDYTPGDPFPAETHEEGLDRLAMETTYLKEIIERSLQLPIGSATGVDPELPAPTALNVIRTNATATGFEFVPQADIVAETQSGFVVVPFTLAAGESVISTGAQTYTTGINQVFIELNGAFLAPVTSNFTQTDSTTITLANPVPTASTGHVIIGVAKAGTMDLASNVSYTPAGTGAVATDVQTTLRDMGALFNQFTSYQAALTAHTFIQVPAGNYTTDSLINIPNSNTCIVLNAGVQITQTTANTGIFKAEGVNNVWIIANGARFVGEGSWSSGWTGNDGHEDRVIQFINCNNCGIIAPNIKNGANAGLYLEACENFHGKSLIIEGVHNNGTTLSANDNFNNAIYIKHDATNGDCKDIFLDFICSNAAQGVLVEGHSSYTGQGDNINLEGLVHTIPGQHGVYCQSGDINADLICRDIELTGVKVQVGSSNHALKNFNIEVNAQDCRSHAVELQNDGTGSITNVNIDLVSHNCERGLGINNDVKNVKGRIVCEDSDQYGLIIQGTGNDDIDLEVTTKSSGRHGIFIDSSDLTNCTLRPKVRQANTTVGSYDGIHINAAADVELIDPEATDTGTNQRYGLFVVPTSGCNVSVRGKAKFTGASSYSARANLPLLAWPEDVTLDGTTAASLLNFDNFFSSKKNAIRATLQTTSASDVTLYQLELADESAYLITADIVGKLENSSERAAYRITGLFYRDAAGSATQQGSTDTDVSIASASFAGAAAFDVNGNNVRIRCNSGGVANYDWEARVRYIEVI